MLPYFGYDDHLSGKHRQLMQEPLDEIELLLFSSIKSRGARDRITSFSTEADVTTLKSGADLILYTHAQ